MSTKAGYKVVDFTSLATQMDKLQEKLNENIEGVKQGISSCADGIKQVSEGCKLINENIINHAREQSEQQRSNQDKLNELLSKLPSTVDVKKDTKYYLKEGGKVVVGAILGVLGTLSYQYAFGTAPTPQHLQIDPPVFS
jgi:uncharacterized phage infection (PIP) family protein YhgE